MAFTKEFIEAEIHRTTNSNGGDPLGQRRFAEETDIPATSWRGVYWRNWSAALKDCGYSPNSSAERTTDGYLLDRLAELTRELGFFPTYADLRLKRKQDSTFPTHQLFNRLGNKDTRIARLYQHSETNSKFSDVLALLPQLESEDLDDAEGKDGKMPGYVYLGLLKVGTEKRYKIGKATFPEERISRVGITLPEDLEHLHHIETDDAYGIENYWHKRFEAKNTKGEWFKLSKDDIRAFKRRKKFM